MISCAAAGDDLSCYCSIIYQVRELDLSGQVEENTICSLGVDSVWFDSAGPTPKNRKALK